jgi:hypothetical protein
VTRTQIVVAIIGFVGIVLAAYIGFLGVQYAAEAPLRASQTAEAQRNANAPSEPTRTVLAPSPTEAARETPTPEGVPPGPTPELEIAIQDPCPLTVMIPGFLDPQEDRAGTQQSIEEADDRSEIFTWPMIGTGFDIWISFESAFDNRTWFRLSNTANVTVDVLGDSPPTANGVELGECGGIGSIRNFPSVPLGRDFDRYSRRISSPEADFFTLQPGEFEIWEAQLTCGAPGRYRLTVEVGYAYGDGTGKITGTSPEIICPLEYNEWTMLTQSLEYVRSFRWNGSDYEQTGP